MTPPADDTVLPLARLRSHGWLPTAGMRLGDVELAADRAGRRLFLTDQDDGPPLAVLGWQGTEPAASQQAPRLARRPLPKAATKTLVIIHALLTDPLADRRAVTTRQALAVIELLTSRSGDAWVSPALQHTLPEAGLITAAPGGWAPGPRMQAWDAATRDVMSHAAQRLWQHPSWPKVP